MLLYSGPCYMGLQIIGSIAQRDPLNPIWQTPKLVLHNSLVNLLIRINQLLESVSVNPKVIPLSSA
jgi:hypothetical protein